METLRCHNCGGLFMSPVYKRDCFPCSGDQEPVWALPVAAFCCVTLAGVVAWVGIIEALKAMLAMVW